MGRLDNKVAIVTGGASGIGLSTCQLMAKEGAKVVIADYNTDGAILAADEIVSKGGQAVGISLDASKEDSIKAMIDFTVEKYGAINILVNNVGTSDLRKDLDAVNIDLDEWDRLMNVNAKSVLLGTRFAVPHMIKAGGGSIVNTASMAAFAGDSVRSAYGASKAAVVALTQYIAQQFGKNLIRCNAVAPGLIMTPAAKNSIPPDLEKIFLKFNALPYHGEPDDIGYTIMFLASDEAKFITGQVIKVEGGHYNSNPTIPDTIELFSNQK